MVYEKIYFIKKNIIHLFINQKFNHVQNILNNWKIETFFPL